MINGDGDGSRKDVDRSHALKVASSTGQPPLRVRPGLCPGLPSPRTRTPAPLTTVRRTVLRTCIDEAGRAGNRGRDHMTLGWHPRVTICIRTQDA
jgi:hypothetical protein